MNTKNNQRYRDMDICMKAAMLELMQKIPFEKITVKSICQRAGVNRGTFYSHYTDMEGMMNDLEEYLSGELLQVVEEWIKYNGSKSIFLLYLRYIKEHQYVYQVTLSNRKALPIKKSFQPLLEHLILPICRTAQITDEEELLYYNVYFQSGITMVLKCWIENGCKKSDEEMNVILMNCVPMISECQRTIDVSENI